MIPLNERPANTYWKEDQLKSTRVRPTQRQMGAISAKVDKHLRERSNGVCERCRSSRAVERAHIIRRGKMTHKTMVNDLAHLCTPCHKWADSCKEGRQWLIDFQKKLMEAESA